MLSRKILPRPRSAEGQLISPLRRLAPKHGRAFSERSARCHVLLRHLAAPACARALRSRLRLRCLGPLCPGGPASPLLAAIGGEGAWLCHRLLLLHPPRKVVHTVKGSTSAIHGSSTHLHSRAAELGGVSRHVRHASPRAQPFAASSLQNPNQYDLDRVCDDASGAYDRPPGPHGGSIDGVAAGGARAGGGTRTAPFPIAASFSSMPVLMVLEAAGSGPVARRVGAPEL